MTSDQIDPARKAQIARNYEWERRRVGEKLAAQVIAVRYGVTAGEVIAWAASSALEEGEGRP